ncbi:MAG: ATP-grasp domain-containing protein [Proteobacteria bacterium]|nr:ATP-grasp domain-containing protein [Pseudomonadota bacterium]
MIESLLVANRGEIACRIFRTARRLGIRTIAVYSDADVGSRHVREADSAVRLGPAPARESYLDAARILAAARASGARAIHPGYGFLSENAAVAAACEAAGLTFVGPRAASIEAMGSKILAKRRMAEAGVPVLPGYSGSEQSLEALEAAARSLPLPLIIKPAAGGGGKGMQIVRTATEIAPALKAARRLAESAFADGALLIERYLAAPRHLEVQVFADTHGHTVHLGERDCSIQRRHQKLIEEAPAPQVPEDVRARLRAAAIVVARAVDYVGAGTVEFLFDGREFYFMEMNTRLQVEHTVTEAVTGLDLVEWQLRVASGEPLPLNQDEVVLRGHAIEARVCAEDPAHGYLPSAGRLSHLHWPQGDGVRVDAGFEGGDTVPDSYDSLLGKVIAWAPGRDEACARLAAALDHTDIAGVRSNERFLAQVLRGAEFREVRHSIALLDSAPPAAPTEVPEGAAVLAALVLNEPHGAAAGDPWAARDGFSPNLPAQVRLQLRCAGALIPVALDYRDGRLVAARTGEGAPVALAAPQVTGDGAALQVAGMHLNARYAFSGATLHLWLEGRHLEFVPEDPRDAEFQASAATGGLTTPLPGVVVSVAVRAGDTVASGATLMVIEAMKMEHTITAPYAGTVSAVHFAPGERVSEGAALIELARGDEPAPKA